MRGPLAGLMQQAQKMQEEMQRAQESLAREQVIGQAGGGLVKVTASGRGEVQRVQIDPTALSGDAEMLEDLIAAAVNDALNRVAELSQQRMGSVTSGLQLPPGFKLPF